MELDDFADALFAAAPAVRDELRRAGDDELPDHEMPTIWMGGCRPRPRARARQPAR